MTLEEYFVSRVIVYGESSGMSRYNIMSILTIHKILHKC